ncbi:MAG: malto-oligosyltrehalose synthase [bacterium]
MANAFIATYRLQLNAQQTFEDARNTLPYLSKLGISHLYLSPIWQAAPGSTHGYDVLDHAAVNVELGGLDGFVRLSEAAKRLGLGIIADIVPNHVYVGNARQEWWRDVLRFGQASPDAERFDIDWSGRGDLPAGLLLLPVLADSFAAELESGHIGLAFDGTELVTTYGEVSYPLSPSTYAEIVGLPPTGSSTEDADGLTELVQLVHALRSATPEESRSFLLRFAALLKASNAAMDWVEKRLRAYAGRPGESSSFDLLDGLFSKQHYRLSSWRDSGEQVNYRRFFDVNQLASLRMEHRPTFEDTHRLVFDLISGGYIQGLRVDHIDGLQDPARYLHLLGERCPGIPIWVEKILAAREILPAWGVAGTTGYEFAAHAESLFVHPSGRASMDATFRNSTATTDDFEEVAFASKYWMADRAFDSDLSSLAAQFHRIGSARRRTREITRRSLREALCAILAGMPRYRTYWASGSLGTEDAAALSDAARAAQQHRPATSPEALDFVLGILREPESEEEPGLKAARRSAVLRFQQLSAPVMAKGVEDTAFYRFVPALFENEVGNSPPPHPSDAKALHAWFSERLDSSPMTLNATTTHDTKRSEDVRARLAVLTEFPALWRAELRQWSRINRKFKTMIAGELFPAGGSEYYLYQTLVGAWQEPNTAFADRISEHMVKASREAKTWTSWTAPNAERERALDAFLRVLLESPAGAEFRGQVASVVERLREGAESNSLALLTLKCLAGGIPDFYQGAEDWIFSLVDPDNRRPVDFQVLEEHLASADSGCGSAPGEPGAKIRLAQRLLQLRRQEPELVQSAPYQALALDRRPSRVAFGFSRSNATESIAVVIRRQVANAAYGGDAAGQLFGSSAISNWPNRRWFDWLHETWLPADFQPLMLLAEHPVAVLTTFAKATN